MYAVLPPSAAMPAIVFPADPPEASVFSEDDLHRLGAGRTRPVDGEQDGLAAGCEQRLLDARGVNGVAVHEEGTVRERLARKPERVGVVPFLRALVSEGLDPQAVAGFEVGHELVDPLGREPGHDDDLLDADGPQVGEHEVEDGALVAEREQRLRELARERPQPPARPRGQDHALHRPLVSSGPMGRRFYHGASSR